MSDIDSARRRNQALVREQRRSLGLDKDGSGTATVIARMPVYAGIDLGQAWASAEKEMREEIEARGGFALSFERVTLLDGTRELRCTFKQHMTRAKAEKELEAKDAILNAMETVH